MHDIQKLKHMVMQTDALSEPFNFFFDLMDANAFDQIKSHSRIINVNKHAELTVIVQIIQNEINHQMGKAIKKLLPVFNQIPEYYFYHGVCLSIDLPSPLAIIYFSDVKTGIFALTGNQTNITRFSLTEVPHLKTLN